MANTSWRTLRRSSVPRCRLRTGANATATWRNGPLAGLARGAPRKPRADFPSATHHHPSTPSSLAGRGSRRDLARIQRRAAAVDCRRPRVGLFGVIGTDNIGNEGMLEAVVAWLKRDHPDAIIDFMCSGPEKVTARYGAPAIPLNWYQKHERAPGLSAIVLRTLGKGIDAYRVASWVRRHDAVIVPGAGVLEATLPVGPWWYPYAMFLLSASGRVCGTKVALVSVGASVLSQRLTRFFFHLGCQACLLPLLPRHRVL